MAIYKGISEGIAFRELIKRIRTVKALNLKMGLPYDKRCERYVEVIAKHMERKKPMGKGTNALVLSEWAFKELNKLEVFATTSKIANQFANDEEGKAKETLLKKMREEAEKTAKELPPEREGEADIFYLCSWHGDSAIDHADYQGKLYYDRFWRHYIKSETLKRKVQSFIDKNKLKSLQWVTNKPVWLITRPNCRHYLERVSINEAFTDSVGVLLQDKGMRLSTGARGDGQTIRHPINRGWYTKENIEAIIAKYKERLAYHEALYKAKPTQLVLDYIEKDKRLIRKWQAYSKRL